MVPDLPNLQNSQQWLSYSGEPEISVQGWALPPLHPISVPISVSSHNSAELHSTSIPNRVLLSKGSGLHDVASYWAVHLPLPPLLTLSTTAFFFKIIWAVNAGSSPFLITVDVWTLPVLLFWEGRELAVEQWWKAKTAAGVSVLGFVLKAELGQLGELVHHQWRKQTCYPPDLMNSSSHNSYWSGLLGLCPKGGSSFAASAIINPPLHCIWLHNRLDQARDLSFHATNPKKWKLPSPSLQ